MSKRVVRGRIKYVPSNVLKVLDEVKKRDGLVKDVDAWGKMGFLAGVGLNIEDNLDAWFGKRRRGKGDLL